MRSSWVFVVAATSMALASCSSLRAKHVKSGLPSSPVRIVELGSREMTEGPGISRVRLNEEKPWQNRGVFSLGAPQQSFVKPQFTSNDGLLISTIGGGIALVDLHSLAFRWNIAVEGGVASRPALTNDAVFVAGLDGQMRKIDLKTGKSLWLTRLGVESTGGSLVSQGLVYVTTANDVLWALDEKTGAVVWSYKRPSQGTQSLWSLRGGATPLLAKNNTLLFVGFSDGTFVGLKALSGESVWERSFDRPGRFRDADTSPTLSPKGDLIYLPLVDGDLVALKITDGSTVYSLRGGSSYSVTVDAAADRAFVAGSDGTIQEFSAGSMSPGWLTRLPLGTLGTEPSLHDDGLLVLTTTKQGLLVLDRKTGTILSEQVIGAGILAPAVSDGRRVVVLDAKNRLHLYRIERRSGV